MMQKLRSYFAPTLVISTSLLAYTFCFFYLTHSHQYLHQWFINLQPCFYESKLWEQSFFTLAAKQTGNIFCVAGILVTTLLLVLFFAGKRKSTPINIIVGRGDKIALASIMLIKVIQSWWASRSIYPYADEVFSSVHCVDDHPFHTLAYYMLPNNHVFFNLLNQILRIFSSDPIFTGRILSGIFSATLGILLYFFFRLLVKNKLIASVLSVAVGLHFGLWGFSGMARGYELYLLCEWGAFIFLLQYFRTNNQYYLLLFALCAIIGFATIPTFLFFFGALIIIVLVRTIKVKKIDWSLMGSMLVIVVSTYLFYLPAVCFSGLSSLFSNDYVRAGNLTYEDAAHQAYKYCMVNLRYCFTGTIDLSGSALYTLLASLPLLLLLRKNKLFGIFYLAMWLMVFLIAAIMRQYPFSRVLSGQMSFTYAFVLLTIYYGLDWLITRINKRNVLHPSCLVIVLLTTIGYLNIGLFRLSEPLYHKDTNLPAIGLRDALQIIPVSSKISVSDQAFIMFYECQQKGLQPIKCGDANEPYRIQLNSEPLPTAYTQHYKIIRKIHEFSIYQRF